MLPFGRISELLETAADLLWRPALSGNLEDVVRDELVAHREMAIRSSGLRFNRLIFFKTC